jgi:hypothetical protein
MIIFIYATHWNYYWASFKLKSSIIRFYNCYIVWSPLSHYKHHNVYVFVNWCLYNTYICITILLFIKMKNYNKIHTWRMEGRGARDVKNLEPWQRIRSLRADGYGFPTPSYDVQLTRLFLANVSSNIWPWPWSYNHMRFLADLPFPLFEHLPEWRNVRI